MPPAARLTDMHVCPMATPGVPPIPHVGGPISAGCPTVMIGMSPAARMGDMAVCVGPPDAIAKGSVTVMIGFMPAARLGDPTIHGGTVVVGYPTVMIGDVGSGGGGGGAGAGAGAAAGSGAGAAGGAGDDPKLALARELTSTAGSADENDKELVAQELAKLPIEILQRMKDKGIKVKVCRGSVTDYLTDLKGVQPRGWPDGQTWDGVPGTYEPTKNEVVIATVGHDTPAGAHVPASGEGHGSQNLVIHETMHGVDYTGDGGKLSGGEEFNKARDDDLGTLSAYESQAGGPGQEETYAESAARYYGGDSNDAANHPNLNNYWASDPMKPKP